VIEHLNAEGNGSSEGPHEPALSPEMVLETLSAQANDTALFPGSVRAEYFFAYDMLQDQAAVARFVRGLQMAKVVSLPHHSLIWPYYSPPLGTALPSLLRTNQEQDCVWGILYSARGRNFSPLNTYLRVPNRYHRCNVITVDRGGRRFPAFTYILSKHDPAPGKPSRGYLDRLLAAAQERELPEEWLAQLSALETAPDSAPAETQG
jgi:hypothetical protein